jgi:hypothetical protein
MIQTFQAWLDALPATSGILAWAVRLAEGQLAIRTLSPSISREALDNATRGASDALRVLQLHRLPAHHLQWSYERGTLHCLRREDQAMLAVLLGHEPTVPRELVSAWASDFLKIPAPLPAQPSPPPK